MNMNNITMTTTDLDNITMTTMDMNNITMTTMNNEPYRSIRNVVNWSIPLVVLTSLFGNTLIMIVMSLPQNRKSSTSVFFMALAVSDILLVLMLPLERWLHWSTNISIYAVNHTIAVIKIILNYSILHCSSWILVCITVERVLSVTVPHKIKTICTVRRSVVTLSGVILLITGVNATAFTVLVNITYDEQIGPNWDSKVPYGRELIQKWDLCMTFIVPFVILSIGSLFIITKLARVSLQKHDKRKHRHSPVTSKLLAANAVFIITMSPFCLFFNLALDVRPDVAFTVSDILLLISDSNAALNFFVYCVSGTRFRADVKKVLCCK